MVAALNFSVFWHLGVGVLLFLWVNFLGKHSYSLGYESLESLELPDQKVAFNFLFRVVTPVIYLVLLSAALYWAGLDSLVSNIHLSLIYYFALRGLYVIVWGRARLVPWLKIAAQWVCSYFLGFAAYINLISKKSNLLPDWTTIGNEVWLAVAVYIYSVASNIQPSRRGRSRRLDRHISHAMQRLEGVHGKNIEVRLMNLRLRQLAYAVMIVEEFNRPKIARILECFLFRFGRVRTLGIMQVVTPKLIDDSESVVIGCSLIRDAYASVVSVHSKWRLKGGADQGVPFEWRIATEENAILRLILLQYNRCEDYAESVLDVLHRIDNLALPNTVGALHPETDSLGYRVS